MTTTKRMTRDEYMDATSGLGTSPGARKKAFIIHHEFYKWMADENTRNRLQKYCEDGTIRFDGDPYLNNIPLKFWDNCSLTVVDGTIEALGNVKNLTPADCVCILKAAARDILGVMDGNHSA